MNSEKSNEDICAKCGCERKYHEEGLGCCMNCNPGGFAEIDGGTCMSFLDKEQQRGVITGDETRVWTTLDILEKKNMFLYNLMMGNMQEKEFYDFMNKKFVLHNWLKEKLNKMEYDLHHTNKYICWEDAFFELKEKIGCFDE